jgi:cation transport regulator ChaB
MPYEEKKDLPEAVKALPDHGQEIWMAAFNSALEEYKNEEKASATAWAAVKNKYEKNPQGEWVAKVEHSEVKMDDWIQIFRTGTHTDSAGNLRDWTEEDLNRIVSQYDPQKHEAPVVVGHPADNAPAFGWVEALKRDGEFLLAKFKNLVPEFVDMIKRGLFKKRSISLYPDLTLRHVGFLGAMAPAVKGLADVKFGEGKPMTIEFTATDADKQAQEARAKRWGIAIKDGGHVTKPGEWANVPDEDFLDPVNYRYPCPTADQTRAAAAYWGKPDNQAQYSSEEKGIINKRLADKEKKFKIGEHSDGRGDAGTRGRGEFSHKEGKTMGLRDLLKGIFAKAVDEIPEDKLVLDTPMTFTEGQVKAREEEAAKRAKEKAEQEFAEKQRAERKEKRAGEIKTYCEGLVKEGKALPAWIRMGLSEFLVSLDGEEEIQFAEGQKRSRVEWMKSFLGELPKVINFKEVATRDKDGSQGTAGEKIQALIKKKMNEKKDLSYGQAFTEVQKENVDLAKEYLAEINANKK